MVEEPPRARFLSRFELGCLIVVALAFVVRIGFILDPNVIWDSAWLLMLSRSFAERGDFWLRWTYSPEEFSGYWPPLFPIFVAPLVKVFGPSYHTLVLGSVISSALLTAAVFFCTRDLYGRTPAFAAMALVAANPAFYVSDSKGMSESLLAFTVTLTVWAFLKSLDRPAWLPVAGLFAFLTYLGKANLGLPFVAAAVVALGAWRVHTRGWRQVVRSKVDVGVAAGVVVAGLLLAATRSGRVGGVGLGLIEPLARSFRLASCAPLHDQLGIIPDLGTGAHCWAILYVIKVFFVAAFLLVVTLPFSLKVIDVIRAPRSERSDALWLGTLLPLLAGAVFTTSFFFTEGRQVADFDNIRYLTPAMVPFLWLTIPHWRFDSTPADAKAQGLARRHFAWFGLAIGAFFLLELLHPIAGSSSLPRLRAFIALALVAIVLGFFAYQTQFGVASRKLASGAIEERFVEAKEWTPHWRTLIGNFLVLSSIAWHFTGWQVLFAVGLLLAFSRRTTTDYVVSSLFLLLALAGWSFSAWYVTVGVGIVVVLTTMSPKARALAAALVLLGSSAPGVESALPLEQAAGALAKLPEGTIVGMSEQIVFPAAIAPDHVQLRLLLDPLGQPIPDDIDALLMQHTYGNPDFVYANFTRIESWNYRHDLSPTLKARVWIEENVLGKRIDYQQARGETLYVRNGTGLDAIAFG